MDTNLAKLPYGISNFKRLVEEGYYFVDKTPYLEVLENFAAPYLIFLRPRRFGKSLWISLMRYYYGKEYKADFDKLFGKYYIGKKPTPLANSYAVLYFEFSRIDTQSAESTFEGFLSNVKRGVTLFIKAYGGIDKQEEAS